MLARGMEKNAVRDLDSTENWRRNKAGWTLKHFEEAVDDAIHDWVTKLLADAGNSTKDFKMLRAERRGILRMNGGQKYAYPENWREVANRIRMRDKCCADCGSESYPDIHHIIYLSRYGTNRQENLVRLCRSCHEKVHGREFDSLELLEDGLPKEVETPEHMAVSTPTHQDAYLSAVMAYADEIETPKPQNIKVPIHSLEIRQAEEPSSPQITRFETLPPPTQEDFKKDLNYLLAVFLSALFGACFLVAVVIVVG